MRTAGTEKPGHSELLASYGLKNRDILNFLPQRGAGLTTRCTALPIHIFSMFDREDVEPLGTDAAVEDAVGPDTVRPDLVFLKLAFQRFPVKRVFGEIAKGAFDSVTGVFVKRFEVFDGLRR
jgi:hypothetical protein